MRQNKKKLERLFTAAILYLIEKIELSRISQVIIILMLASNVPTISKTAKVPTIGKVAKVPTISKTAKVPTISKVDKVPKKRCKLTFPFERTKWTWIVDCV